MKTFLLQTFNPGKVSLAQPNHTYVPLWALIPLVLLCVVISVIAYNKYLKERKSGASKAELERKALEELIGRKINKRK